MTTPAGDADPKIALKAGRQDVQALYRAGVQARTNSALTTEAPFVERMVHSGSDHFCGSVDSPPVTAFADAFERDSIRPNVLGRFSDMMLAVERHPAMLLYIDQAQSVGPDSMAAARDPDRTR